MKRSGGFAVVETLIFALIVAILVLGGYYVAKRNHQKTADNENSSNTVAPPAKSTDPTKLNITQFGIQLVNVPSSIKDLFYTYFPATTDANYTQADFTTTSLYLKEKDCTIGELIHYPGKYNADNLQAGGNFVKQFDGFWIEEIDMGVPCTKSKTVLNLQNTQINTFKQFVTKPDNLQVIKQ